MRDPAGEQLLLGLLGVDEDTPWEEVRRAFRDGLRSSHPDLHPEDPEAEARAKALNASWETINTPEKWSAFVRRRLGRGSGRDDRTAARTDVTVGRIRIIRQQRGSVGLLDWWLELDGVVAGSIENGGVCMLEAEPGPHALRAYCGSRSSPVLRVHLRGGEEVLFGCRQPERARVGLRERSLVLERLDARGRPL